VARNERDTPDPVTFETDTEPDPLVLDESPKRPKESDPLPESDPAPERPYEEAITDEHRAHLEEFGIRIPKPKDKK
jgi:hypothetical protein